MHKCDDILMYCKWQGKIEKCMDIFSVIKTDVGFCCSFNAVNQAALL